MASTVIPSVHSALDNIELLENSSSDVSSILLKARLRGLKHALRKLRTFLLCARKLATDVHLQSNANNSDKARSLRSLLEKIADVACRNGQEIHPKDGIPSNVFDKVKKFELDIDSLVGEINEWYIIFSNYSWRSSCPTTNEVMDIADSILESLVDFTNGALINKDSLFGVSRFYPFVVIDPIEALGEKIKFLQNFIRFATLQGVGLQELEELLIHSQAVVVNAAYLTSCLSGMNPRSSDFKRLWERMQFKISDLLRTIKPIDSHVYQTYTQVLISSKLSSRICSPNLDLDNDSMIIVKDFTDSLLGDLWEILQESCPVISVKDQLQTLYEELRFFRNILKQQSIWFDEKIKNLLGGVICDAGVIIFSLHEKNVKTDLGLKDLLERIKIMRAASDLKFAEMSIFSFSKTNEQVHFNFLVEKLMELTSLKDQTHAYSSQVKIITQELVFLRSFFRETVELQNEQGKLQALWDRVVEVAYKVEFLIDPMEVGEVPDYFPTLFESITEDIQNIKTDALLISGCRRQDIHVKEATRTSNPLPSENIAPVSNEVAGFDAEATSIIERLTRGSKQLRIFSIVGMPGLGKTTLATKVYNDSSVMRHFHVRAWCHVSQVFNKGNVLLELLKQVVTDLPPKVSEMNEQDLAEYFRRRLKGRTYLIFLDDVWDIEAWNGMEGSLPDDLNGSRIILTTRIRDIVPRAEPYFLRQLTNEESWELLQKKLYPENGCPPGSLHELGMQIAEKCRGLPLTIVIVSGLLATMEQERWEEVLENLNSGIIVSSTEQCMNTIELSYKHLPNHLKLCLLYLGAFPAGQEVTVKRLIWLWIAEGFVAKSATKSLEDVATDYMKDLVGRSLIMVAKQRSIGGFKTCRIHDLLHDFCVPKARGEGFFQLIKGYDELSAFNEPRYMRRLCIYSKPKQFKESRIFCPRARSLLFFSQRERSDPNWLDISSWVTNIFKLLKVLDIEQIDLGCVFPSEIKVLGQLKYLAIQGLLQVIPSCIGNLKNLETFILHPRGMLPTLPDAIWDLHKLRNIWIRRGSYKFASSYLPFKNLDNSSDLCELESCSGAIMLSGVIMEKQMKKLPHMRKLKVRIVINGADAENMNRIVVPEFLCRLESLNMAPLNTFPDHIEPEIGFPKNLKKLTLSRLRLPWSKVSAIGELPNLEVLKLQENSFSGETWEMGEGEFRELKFLKLGSLGIVRWTDSEDDPLPSLEKLVLEDCTRLEELPSCLESSPTLEMIEVASCPQSVSDLVQQIQDLQMDMGNPDIKLLIHRKSYS